MMRSVVLSMCQISFAHGFSILRMACSAWRRYARAKFSKPTRFSTSTSASAFAKNSAAFDRYLSQTAIWY